MQYYTPEEFIRYITYARERAVNASDTSEWDFYVFFNIAFYTGLRKGEINALKWSDIKGEYLSVKRSINQKLNGPDRETAPKNKSSIRTLQLPWPLLKVLAEHKERQRRHPEFSEDFRVCGGPKCLRDTTIDKKNRAYAKGAGLKRIRIHDFRHSHASLLANEGINIQEIARRLGHSNIEVTWNTYSHLYPREEERAVKILNSIAPNPKNAKKVWIQKTTRANTRVEARLVEGDGFEPSKSSTTDLQSAPFGRSGIPPNVFVIATGPMTKV